MQTFTVTENHLKLLPKLNWSDDEPTPTVDTKRPYGNKAYFQDIKDATGIFEDEKCKTLHNDMKTVLEILTKTGSIEIGQYQQPHPFDSWKKMPETIVPQNNTLTPVYLTYDEILYVANFLTRHNRHEKFGTVQDKFNAIRKPEHTDTPTSIQTIVDFTTQQLKRTPHDSLLLKKGFVQEKIGEFYFTFSETHPDHKIKIINHKVFLYIPKIGGMQIYPPIETEQDIDNLINTFKSKTSDN